MSIFLRLPACFFFFFFNDTATTEISPLPLHDALPILRPGGDLIYRMTAVAPEQVAFMKRAGMPLTSECKVTYTEVSPPRRLAYKTLADFVLGVAPYEVATVAELKATVDGVELTITFDAMHDDVWTERARAGHESQIRKLDALLSAQGKGVRS